MNRFKKNQEKMPLIMNKNIYVVLNFGAFRDVFYLYRDAKKFVREEGTSDTGERYYQIFKCDLIMENWKPKS
jgi:hypothetical protein